MLKFFKCMIFSRRLQSPSAKLPTTAASEHRRRLTGGDSSGAGAVRCFAVKIFERFSIMTMTINMTEDELPMNDVEAAAILLSGHPEFRVLKRISGTADLALPVLGNDEPFKIGVAVDIETTGLDSSSDTVIELAVQRFKFNGKGRIVEVGLPRSWLQDPGFPLETDFTRITSLTDDDLQAQAIDGVAACNILNSADLVIAHNAGVDRGFVEARLPAAAGPRGLQISQVM